MLCLGGPYAGQLHAAAGDRRTLHVPQRMLPPARCYDPGDMSDAVYSVFTYRLERFCGLELWIPADWQLADIVEELARNYRPNATKVERSCHSMKPFKSRTPSEFG